MQLSLFQPVDPSGFPPATSGKNRFSDSLRGSIPDNSLPIVTAWFIQRPVRLIITRSRTSKYGDFRPPKGTHQAIITVNQSLNPYAFLITLVHEMAHFEVFTIKKKRWALLKRPKRILPHGPEWKQSFRELMEAFLSPDHFPSDILHPLEKYMQNPLASTTADIGLSRVLMAYDTTPQGTPVEKIPEGALFATASGMVFLRQEKIRKRFRCRRQSDNRIYLFSPLARVFPING